MRRILVVANETVPGHPATRRARGGGSRRRTGRREAHAGRGQSDGRRAGAARAPEAQGGRGAAAIHRDLPAVGRRRRSGRRRTRAPGPHPARARTGRARRDRAGGAPRPLHRDPERAPVLRARRNRDLDLSGDPLRVDAERSHRPGGGLDRQARRPRRERGGELMEAAAHAVHEHAEHPPAANVPSRVEAQFLGMLLFIISEVMLFGAFFTAYFFIRVVGNADWPARGEEVPVAIAGVNTAILLSSSFTMHFALEGARNENRNALRVGILTTFL